MKAAASFGELKHRNVLCARTLSESTGRAAAGIEQAPNASEPTVTPKSLETRLNCSR